MIKHKKIALTGGPNSGKTTALTILKETFGPQVELVREAATMVFSGGFPRQDNSRAHIEAAQKIIFVATREMEELAQELKKIEKSKIVVGDGAKLCYNVMQQQGIVLDIAPEHLRMQSAWGVARAAAELIARDGLVPGNELAPVYHRLSQAERERLERENGKQ